jgi:hypothetical protein
MKTAWYFLFAGCSLCLSAGTASAQRFVAVAPSPPQNPAQFVQPDPPSTLPDDGTWEQGWPGTGYPQDSSSETMPQETKSEQQAVYGYATGDKHFVASQYMDYNKALELGKKILAQQSAPKPASTDVVAEVPRQAPTKPTDSKNIVVEQDNDGKLLECKGTGSTCHPIN